VCVHDIGTRQAGRRAGEHKNNCGKRVDGLVAPSWSTDIPPSATHDHLHHLFFTIALSLVPAE